MGLAKFVKKKAKHLSLGVKQRLGIVIAMLGNQELLVLDEPINRPDPEGIVQLRQVIEDLNAKQGVTIFIALTILGNSARLQPISELSRMAN